MKKQLLLLVMCVVVAFLFVRCSKDEDSKKEASVEDRIEVKNTSTSSPDSVKIEDPFPSDTPEESPIDSPVPPAADTTQTGS